MHQRALTLLIALAVVCLAAGQSSDELLKQLKDPEARIRWIAAEKLGRKRIKAAIPGARRVAQRQGRSGAQACRIGHCTAKRLYKTSRVVQPLRGTAGRGWRPLTQGALSTATLGFECATSSR